MNTNINLITISIHALFSIQCCTKDALHNASNNCMDISSISRESSKNEIIGLNKPNNNSEYSFVIRSVASSQQRQYNTPKTKPPKHKTNYNNTLAYNNEIKLNTTKKNARTRIHTKTRSPRQTAINSKTSFVKKEEPESALHILIMTLMVGMPILFFVYSYL